MKKLASIALAAGLAVTGVSVGTVVTASAAEAATCCNKLPAGTWGGRTSYVDRHAYWEQYSAREVRYRYETRMYWDGTKWYDAIYYNGYYYSGVSRA